MSTRHLTTFFLRLDGRYYRYTVLPFGIRPALFFMQGLASALAREARARVCPLKGNVAVLSAMPTTIFRWELRAVILAILLAPQLTIVRCDNQAVLFVHLI
ncbi:hypothetical protein HPB47_018042 [Ixodes persulcatus]|uniref:Uncharacterized protein n=1 Tax=Ixodes persulcatus TaxID=34615 RepID=A0AC60QMJ9_IXOPE|nr:hypothetical protein HPB47_018042 [Ixodes persulcatus]